METCRIGIIGAGRIGKIHAENMYRHLPQFQLMGIADPYMDLNWAETLNVSLLTADCDEIIHHPDIDAVLIASPSSLHIEQIMAAIRAKKAIFCEKPIGLSEEEIRTCLSEVESQHTLLQVGFNRRFDPSFAYLQERVQAGEIGQPHIIRITSRDPACPSLDYIKTSGGMFMDMTIHDFDMMRFVCHSEVVEVFAIGAVLIKPEFAEYNDIDTATIHLRFANGSLGVIDNSRQAIYGYDQRIEVFGSKGMLLAHNQNQHRVETWNTTGRSKALPPYFFLERYHIAYIAELKAFYQTWVNAKPSLVSGEDGLQALRIAKAAQHSLMTQQLVRIDHEDTCSESFLGGKEQFK